MKTLLKFALLFGLAFSGVPILMLIPLLWIGYDSAH